MKRRVLKHPIKKDNTVTTIVIPAVAKILHGDFQDHTNSLQLWFEDDVREDGEGAIALAEYEVIFLGTGRELEGEGWRFLNTFLMRQHWLVFHVYTRRVGEG